MRLSKSVVLGDIQFSVPFGYEPPIITSENVHEATHSLDGYGTCMLWFLCAISSTAHGHDEFMLAECHTSIHKPVATLRMFKNYKPLVESILKSWNPTNNDEPVDKKEDAKGSTTKEKVAAAIADAIADISGNPNEMG